METEAIGIVITALISIGGLIGAFMKLIVTPINQLNVSITKLNTTLAYVVEKNDCIEEQVEDNTKRLNHIDVVLALNNMKKP